MSTATPSVKTGSSGPVRVPAWLKRWLVALQPVCPVVRCAASMMSLPLPTQLQLMTVTQEFVASLHLNSKIKVGGEGYLKELCEESQCPGSGWTSVACFVEQHNLSHVPMLMWLPVIRRKMWGWVTVK